jgi:hypothetical protein
VDRLHGLGDNAPQVVAESHNRSDFPDLDPEFQVNLTYAAGGAITREPVATTPRIRRGCAR